MHIFGYQTDKLSSYLSKLKSMLTTKDTLPTQLYYLYYAISKNLSAEKKVDILLQALSCTLPNFDIHFIYNYRLSWAELSLLTNIAFEYQTIDANKSNVYSFDICFMNSFLSPTLTMYCTNLYIQKHYYELLDLLSEKNFSVQKKSLRNFGYFFFYYAQALGEVKKYNAAKLYGHYACAIQELFESKPNSDVLKESLLKDFDIKLS